MRFIFLFPLLLCAAKPLSPKVGSSSSLQSNSVLINMADEPSGMDPTKQVEPVSQFWLGHIFEGLMTTNEKGLLVPGAAEKMLVSPDGKTYQFFIRPSAKWHDGMSVKAQDFEFAFRRLVDPKYASEYSQIAITAQIENAREIIDGKQAPGTLGVKAVSNSELVIKLNQPVAFFPELLAFQSFFPVREDLVEKLKDKFSTRVESIIGNGPFKLVSWKKENSMRLEKSSNYWNAKAIKLSAIEMPVLLQDRGASYNLFATGGLDITDLDAERLQVAMGDKKRIRTFNSGAVNYLELNQRPGKIFSNQKLRSAVRYGMNRAEIVNKVVAIPGNKASFGLVPDFIPGSKSSTSYRSEAPMGWKDGDTAKASALVAEYVKENGPVPEIKLLAGDNSNAKKVGDYIQGELARICKCKVTVMNVPLKVRLQKMRDGEFDVVLAAWVPDYKDALTFMDLFLTDNEKNRGKFVNEQYDANIRKAMQSQDLKERVKLFHEAEKVLIENAGIVPLYQVGRVYLLRNRLEGVRRNQIGQDPDFRFAHWK